MIAGWVDFAAVGHRIEPSPRIDQGDSPAIPQTGRRYKQTGLEIRIPEPSAEALAEGSILVISLGTPRFPGSTRLDRTESTSHAAAWHALYLTHRERAPEHVHGSYALVIVDLPARSVLLATDRFSTHGLCYHCDGDRISFSSRADSVPATGDAQLDPQALFDYLYFHVIPAPRTVFKGVSRLPQGTSLWFKGGQARLHNHWRPAFAENGLTGVSGLRDEFRRLIRDAVEREAEGRRVGCFLSGGTDSSTVAGMLCQVLGTPAKTYSIGFDAQGYDEMEYARLASRHFGTDHHEHYLTPDELLQGIPKVAAHYDQPFGNSSVVPAYYCARLAGSDGVDKLLAGDGGDELFGGNTRYAKQRVFEAYWRIPGSARTHIFEKLVDATPMLERIPVIRKGASYVRQARIPMPDRMNTYNLLVRLGIENVLTPEFLDAVQTDAPQRLEREVYARTHAAALINRMLQYDWKFTLADNDLPKVRGATELAGIQVGFPLLSDDLVDFSLRLAPSMKLRGLQLRHFFKEALRGFLPDEIIRKKKHGFGLPFGVWLTRDGPLQDFAFGSLAALAQRGIVKRQFIDDLISCRISQHPGFYGELVWILMMLEQWLQQNRTAGRTLNGSAVVSEPIGNVAGR